MTERKHTPGPWTRNRNDILVGANGEPIVLAGSRFALGADRGNGERIANNALVESAPQLLADLDTARAEAAALRAEVEAMRAVVEAINAAQDEADKGMGNGFGYYCDAVEKARALRAKGG